MYVQGRLGGRSRGAGALSTATDSNAPCAAPPAAYSAMDVDGETDSNHDTALTLACAGGHEELVELLLSRGADIEHRDKKVNITENVTNNTSRIDTMYFSCECPIPVYPLDRNWALTR